MKRIIIVLAVITIAIAAIFVGRVKNNDTQYHENAEYVNNDEKYEKLYDEINFGESEQSTASGLAQKSSNNNSSYYTKRSLDKYKVTFACPNNWKTQNNKSESNEPAVLYSGNDGFLKIGILNGNNTELETIALNEVYQSGQPYGKAPKIYTAKMNGLKGVFVIPSSDQNEKYDNKALCIVEYPKPVTIDNNQYQYIYMISVKSKIGVIAKTLNVVEQ